MERELKPLKIGEIDPKKAKKEKENENVKLNSKFNLDEWDPMSLPHDFFLVLEGKRRTGKTTFAKWLLQYYPDAFSLAWCMTKTKATGFWQEFVGEAFTFDGWYPSAVERLIERNDKIIKEHGEDSEMTRKLAASLIILDDVISERLQFDPTLTRLAVEGRHHLISVIFMTQDPKAIGPKIRDNCDAAVVFNLKTQRNKESLWSDFMNDLDKKTGIALAERYCFDHNALVCVQTNLDGDVKKNFFKSTGDKTKLENPDYCLGAEPQKELIRKEREEKAKKSKQTKERDKKEMKMVENLIAQNREINPTAFKADDVSRRW